MLLYPYLMAKLVWELAGNRDFSLISLRHETCQHYEAGKVWRPPYKHTWVFITLLYMYKKQNIYYCSPFMMAYHHLMAKPVYRAGIEIKIFPILFQHGAVKSMVEGSRYFCEHVSPYNHTIKGWQCRIYALLLPFLMWKSGTFTNNFLLRKFQNYSSIIKTIANDIRRLFINIPINSNNILTTTIFNIE